MLMPYKCVDPNANIDDMGGEDFDFKTYKPKNDDMSEFDAMLEENAK